ncbi:MAG: HEPN domain-containing protein [Bacteroidia bacterium]|nr:HEPN domain-containing protein [Bacteroidia bacterium]
MSEKIDTIKKWITVADHDLGTAIIVYHQIPKYKETIAFHCQQAVEKYLKAFLIFLDVEFKRSHDLMYLLGLISDKVEISDELFEKATTLKSFAVQIRYPDIIIDLSDEELQVSISITKEFRAIILGKMPIHIDDNELVNR